MAILISGIVIFVVMAVIAAISWIVGTIQGAADQPPIIKVIVVVGVIGTIITAICYFFDDSIV